MFWGGVVCRLYGELTIQHCTSKGMVRAVWEDLLEEEELSWTGSARGHEYSRSGRFTFTEAARPLYQSVSGDRLHVRNRHLR